MRGRLLPPHGRSETKRLHRRRSKGPRLRTICIDLRAKVHGLEPVKRAVVETDLDVKAWKGGLCGVHQKDPEVQTKWRRGTPDSGVAGSIDDYSTEVWISVCIDPYRKATRGQSQNGQQGGNKCSMMAKTRQLAPVVAWLRPFASSEQ